MIAAGRMVQATEAVRELRASLALTRVRMVGVHVGLQVWDCPGHGPLRLVELGSLHPASAQELAALVRKGALA